MDIFEKIDSVVEAADAERCRIIKDYMRPLIQKEFDRVRKHNPRLYRIAWWNGGASYFFNPEQEEDERWGDFRPPKYAEKLCKLVDLISNLTWGLDTDIVAIGTKGAVS